MFGISRGFLLAAILLEVLHAVYGGVKDDSKLVRRLMRYYNRQLIPDGPKGAGVPVKHGLFLNRIISLEDQVLTISGYVAITWNDERLKWGKDFSTNALRLDSQSLWQPDLILMNSPEPKTDMGSGNIKAVVTRDGDVSVYIPQTIKSYCKDHGQEVTTCDLKYVSWTYDNRMIDLQNFMNTPDLTYFDRQFNKEFDLDAATSTVNNVKYDCCPDKYADITYALTLRRKSSP